MTWHRQTERMIAKGPTGYIALISLLVVASAALTIGLALSLQSFEEMQTSYASGLAAEAHGAAMACIEDGLGRLRLNWADDSGTLMVNSDYCILDTVVSGSMATLTATGTADIYQKKIKVELDRDMNVTRWRSY